MRRASVGLALLLAAAAPQASGACVGGYAYAGVEAPAAAAGIGATIMAAGPVMVSSGHVAAWIGVGGDGFAPDGGSEWLQAGVAARPSGGLTLYYELKLPGAPKPILRLLGRVREGEHHRLTVVELSARRGWWTVLLDGRSVLAPVWLVGSEDGWQPLAVAESWDGGVGVCNRFAYRFDAVRVLSRGQQRWRALVGGAVLADPGYQLRRLAGGGLLARSAP